MQLPECIPTVCVLCLEDPIDIITWVHAHGVGACHLGDTISAMVLEACRYTRFGLQARFRDDRCKFASRTSATHFYCLVTLQYMEFG